MFEPLFKRASGGAVQVWQIRVEPHDDGTATIVTTHGQLNGAMQEARDHIKEGKNPGKKNATTPQQQAIKEAESKWRRQLERNHYGLTVEESEAKKFVAPMLAQKFTESDGSISSYAQKVQWGDTINTNVQPKFDGHRCLAIRGEQGIELFTRKGDLITTCGHLVDQLMSVMPVNTIFDGELYTHGVAVTTIGGYIKKKQEGTKNLCFMMYDMVMQEASFAERMAKLIYLTANRGTHLHVARTQPAASMDEVMEFQAQCVEHGYEGAILRHGRTGYEAGARSGSLLKVKTFLDGEYTIVGCKEGRGGYAGAAVFECVTEAGHKFDVTAPGTIPEKQAIWQNHQAYLGKRLTIKFQTMTKTAEPVPFQPVAKCISE